MKIIPIDSGHNSAGLPYFVLEAVFVGVAVLGLGRLKGKGKRF